VRDVQANGRDVVRQLLAKAVREPSKPPRGHADTEIAALDVAGADLALRANVPAPLYPYYYTRRIAPGRVDRRLGTA